MKGCTYDFAFKLFVFLNAKGLDWMCQASKWDTETWPSELMFR